MSPAAERDLALIRAGHRPELRYGPFTQLRDAGYITGSQDDWQPCDQDESMHGKA